MNIKVCGIELIPAYVGDYELGLVVDPGDLSGVSQSAADDHLRAVLNGHHALGHLGQEALAGAEKTADNGEPDQSAVSVPREGDVDPFVKELFFEQLGIMRQTDAADGRLPGQAEEAPEKQRRRYPL